jgi:hypothetical protein
MTQPDRFAKLKLFAQSKPHGVRARYVAGCRCDLCRAATNTYEKRRNKLRQTWDYNGIVPADTAREYLQRLSAKGIGRHSVAAASGISDSILFGIVSGDRPNCRARTERKILAVDESVRAGGSLVDARATWRKLDGLIRLGYTKTFLAQCLGLQGHPPSLQFSRGRITYATAVRVEKLVKRIAAGKVRRP